MPKVTQLRHAEQGFELKENGGMGLGTGRGRKVLGIGKLVSGGSLRGIPHSPSKPRAGDGEERRNAAVGARAHAASCLVAEGQKTTEQSGRRDSR